MRLPFNKSTAVHTAGWSVFCRLSQLRCTRSRSEAPVLRYVLGVNGPCLDSSQHPSPPAALLRSHDLWHTGLNPASHKCDHPTGLDLSLASRLWLKSFISTMKRFYLNISVPKPTEMYCLYRQMPLSEMHHHKWLVWTFGSTVDFGVSICMYVFVLY